MLSMVGKIIAGILVDRVRRVTGGLNDDEQDGFRAGRGCVDQNFKLKQIGENAQEKKRINLEKVYDRINREAFGKC